MPHRLHLAGAALAAIVSWATPLVARPVAAGELPAGGAVRDSEGTASGLADRLAAEDPDALIAAAEEAGDAARGAVIFQAAHLACVKCHATDDQPTLLGPRLDAMPPGVARDRLVGHVIESLLTPSAVIQPEYRGVGIVDDSGRAVVGIVVRETDQELVLRSALQPDLETTIQVSSIAERTESSTSLMPTGLANLLGGRSEFLDLVKYLVEIARGGVERAAELRPASALLAAAKLPAYERDIDHAAFLAEWSDPDTSQQSLARGEALYGRACSSCHGTIDTPGSLPTAPRFADAGVRFKAGSDPLSMYRTLTNGAGQMAAQRWMVPSQKYDVIHYLRETFLKRHDPSPVDPLTPEYLAALPQGTSRGPKSVAVEPWRVHDYGPFLAGSFEVGGGGGNVARKGLAIRLDAGAGGVGNGRAWMLYELDTLRMAAAWTGSGFIDWAGINFDGRHNEHPRIAGDVQFVLPTMPGWGDPTSGSFLDPRPLGRDGRPFGPLPRMHARFHALHHAGDRIVLEYSVGDARVFEVAGLEPPVPGFESSAVFSRGFSIGPRLRPLAVRLGSEPVAAALVGRPQSAGQGEKGMAIVRRDGFVDLLIPAGTDDLDVCVAVAAVPFDRLEAHAAALPVPDAPARLVGRPSAPLWAAPIRTTTVRGEDAGPFAVDLLKVPSPNPWNAQVRFSGVDFIGTDGDAAVLCSWDGDVWRCQDLSSESGRLTWRRIATGLYQPLGIKVIDGGILVGCRDRIVRLVDLDGDGQTDRYDTFNDDHQVTEHFHEFAMGLEADGAGNIYYAKSARHALPAVVPHHGTLLRVKHDGSETEILATGFRAANGVCVEPDGTFWVTDQEGHWNPKNRINHVRPRGFYGNMLGYHAVTDERDEAMEPPVIWISNSFDRSPAELLRVDGDGWRGLDGRLLELSYGEGRIHLVLDEPSARVGVRQGGMVALPMPDLPTGVMRGRFSPGDGQLYACGLHAWAGNRTDPGGFFRIRRTALPLTIPVGLHAEPGRIVLDFQEPLDPAAASDTAAWRVKTWGLERSKRYGSKHIDERQRDVTVAAVSADGLTVSLSVPELQPTWCYELRWQVRSASGGPISGMLHGTMHTPAPSVRGAGSSVTVPAAGAAARVAKVFVLAGQSNMEGQAVVDLDGDDYNGGRGTLVDLFRDPNLASRFSNLRNPDGSWRTRDDVFVRYQRESQPLLTGPLGIGYSVYGGSHHFGAELQFGHVVGDWYASVDGSPVVLVKTAWGGKSLFKDFRPRSAGPASDAAGKPVSAPGPYYTTMIEQVRGAVAAVPEFVPGAIRGELAGFVWWHGWNDGCDPKRAVPAYEENLASLIRDVRRDLGHENLPFVIGELTGPWIDAPAGWSGVRQAQAAVASRPEFAAGVRFVATRDCVRAAEDSPNPGHGHHEFGNAETYLLVGDALGKAMVSLLSGTSPPLDRGVSTSD